MDIVSDRTLSEPCEKIAWAVPLVRLGLPNARKKQQRPQAAFGFLHSIWLPDRDEYEHWLIIIDAAPRQPDADFNRVVS
jgi:hypothetical protein